MTPRTGSILLVLTYMAGVATDRALVTHEQILTPAVCAIACLFLAAISHEADCKRRAQVVQP
jgi:hypothetical protein